MPSSSPVVQLAIDQLVAYNASDLDGFCACYHDDVCVLNEDGTESLRGMEAFRERYRPMFERGQFGGTVDERTTTGPHCVEREHYWRNNADGTRVQGTILVRYTERDGRIGTVQFFR
ncbi:MAG: nuclear transport factor 2 family protein [Deltaproteobacteria bacterium]|nr:nuclear transport factor 2 family protein [Deltaproteobacteria bacterium]